ncbi:MAG: TRAM domain-containing protein, partial [Nanoarchaeota archaeon]|nr:TRAM domain-containing protein [Nanoarchaeota archaeon]
NNDILYEMNRKYTVEGYVKLINKIRTKFPQITLATDLITGYPSETDAQHWDTLNLLRQIPFDVINISRFWPRPKTKAAEYKQLPEDIIKHRSGTITSICQNISRLQNERWLGRECNIIIDEQGKEPQQWIGRNSAYKPVIIEGNYKLGQIIKVKIKKHTTFDLRGEILS